MEQAQNKGGDQGETKIEATIIIRYRCYCHVVRSPWGITPV